MSADTSSYVFLAMTANGWGSAKTEAAAVKACRSHMGHSHTDRYGYAVYRVHPDFRIDDVNGSIMTPKGHPAIKITDKIKKRA